MANYRTPGVYFEWLDARNRAITPLRTDIAGFVGIAQRGPLHRPVRVESWTQFASAFGQHIPQGYLAYAVEGFFANGGRTCWVVRVGDPDTARPAWLNLADKNGLRVLGLTAATGFVEPRALDRSPDETDAERDLVRRADPGVWGRDIRVRVIAVGRTRFSLELSLPGGAREFWRDLSLDAKDPRYVEKLLNDPLAGSRLVTAQRLIEDDQLLPPVERTRNLGGGADGLVTLDLRHFSGIRGDSARGAEPATGRWGLAALELVDEVSVLAMPDIMPKPRVETQPTPPVRDCRVPEAPADQPDQKQPTLATDNAREWPREFGHAEILELQRELIAQCELLKDRMTVLDPRIEDVSQEKVVELRNNFDTKYAALYFPWLMVPDPLRLEGLLRAVPPSGHIAGIYARGDWRVGVHKPPANEELEGVLDIATSYFERLRATPAQRWTGAPSDVLSNVEDIAHGDLNDRQINVVRAYPGRGLRVMGARTLSSDTMWRYVNVRRLLIMIEEAIEERSQWITFEPNNPDLWREIDRVVRSFLDELWRRGMLDGATAEQAYDVACDRSTNPPEEIERGQVICRVGVQPPWPAEFVIVRIGKTENTVEIIEEPGG